MKRKEKEMFSKGTTFCSAKRVGQGHWCVSGCIPSMTSDDHDEVSVFMFLDDRCATKLHPVKMLVAKAEGGYDSMRMWLVDRGYLTPFIKRSMETATQTNHRRLRTYASRVRQGLPATTPNTARGR